MHTERLRADDAGFARAAELLGSGALVAFPTETVYGLGGDARSEQAVAGIYAAKGRPSFNPLIVHVSDLEAADAVVPLSPTARRLAEALWPGALTLILPLRPEAGLSSRVTAGLETVAMRIPSHPAALGLLRAFGGPVAAPSANPSGGVSPTRAAHVLEGLDGRVAAVLDGGACPVGVESTILSLVDETPRLLRPGGVTAEALADLLGDMPETGPESVKRPIAPGQLSSHYAPNAAVRLNVSRPVPEEIWIGFGPECEGAAFNLSETGDLQEAAATLFHTLREADKLGQGQQIAIAPIPDRGIGRAINDRLRRAAAPRG